MFSSLVQSVIESHIIKDSHIQFEFIIHQYNKCLAAGGYARYSSQLPPTSSVAVGYTYTMSLHFYLPISVSFLFLAKFFPFPFYHILLPLQPFSVNFVPSYQYLLLLHFQYRCLCVLLLQIRCISRGFHSQVAVKSRRLFCCV
jgi:hypothetical protein